MCRAHAVGEAGIGFQRAFFQELDRQCSRIGEGHNLVVLSVKNEGRHVVQLQVFREIGFGKGLDAIVVGLDPAHHALPPPVVAYGLGDFGAGSVESVERHGEVLEKLGPMVRCAVADPIEYFDGNAAWIFLRLDHDGWYGADQYRLGHATLAMACDITGDFATAGGMTDVDGILEIERFRELGHVCGIGVHFIAGHGLGGTAMSTTIMGNDAVTLLQEEHYLVVPVISAQRPAVMEDNRLTFAPILVKNLGAVLGGDRAHVIPFVCGVRWPGVDPLHHYYRKIWPQVTFCLLTALSLF